MGMIFGNDKVKLLIVILLVTIVLLAVTILAKLNVWVTITVGIAAFIEIILIALYGYDDDE